MQHKFDEAVRTRLDALPDGHFDLEGTWNRISPPPRRVFPWGRWVAGVTACIAVWILIRLSEPAPSVPDIVVRKTDIRTPKTPASMTAANPRAAIVSRPAITETASIPQEVSPVADPPAQLPNWDTVTVSPEVLVYLPEIHPAPAKEERDSFGATVTLIIPEQPVKKSFWTRFRKRKETPSLWPQFRTPEAVGKAKTDSIRTP